MKAPLLKRTNRLATTVYKKMTSGKDSDLSDNRLEPTSTFSPINGSASGLELTVVANGIKLDWVNGSTNETGILIERSVDRIHFAGIGVAGNGVGTFTDETAAANTAYAYRVMAFKGYAYSEKSVAVTEDALPTEFALWDFSDENVTETQLLDTSGSNRHLTLLGGLNPYFKVGFAQTSDGTKYPKDPISGVYTGLNYSDFHIEYPPFAVEADQFFKSPVGDSFFIAKDAAFRFYDEDGVAREFAFTDLEYLITPYLDLTITDNIYINATITL